MQNYKIILADKIIQNTLFISVAIYVLTLIIALITFHLLPPLIPIFNQRPWGQARIGTSFELFIPFGIVLLILASNTFVATRIYDKLPLVSRMFIITTAFATILLFLFLLRTLFVVLY